jgi:DHA3 family macrolide efflux protein-like MFS transporter
MVDFNEMMPMTLNNSVESHNLKAYLFFWIGQMLSQLASNVVQFVIVLWIALETRSLFLLGLAAFAGFAPFIITTPLAGVFVDRWSRKKLIISMDFLQALTTLLLYLLFLLNMVTVWHILVLSAIRGVFQGFHMPATDAIVPILVPKENLNRINGLNQLTFGLVGLVGPMAATLLLLFWEIREILLLDPVTFLIAVIPTLIINIPSIKKESSIEKKSSFKAEFQEGIFFIRDKRGLLSLLSLFTTVNLLMQPFYVLFPLFLLNIHSVHGEKELSGIMALLFGVQQAGMLIGSVFMSLWKGFNRNVVGVVIGILTSYVCLLMIVLIPPSGYAFLIIGGIMFINGFSIPVSNVPSQTIWQSVVPPNKMGRVMSVRSTIAWFAIPVGMLLSGIVAEIIGILELFLVCAILGLMSLVYCWLMTGLPDIEKTLQSEITSVEPIPTEALQKG